MPPIPAAHRALLEKPGVAAFTTIGADGYPQTTAIWFLLDGDVVRTSLHQSRQKLRNALRHPQATLFLIDPANPYHTLEIRGDVEVEEAEDTSFLERLLGAVRPDAGDVRGADRQPRGAHADPAPRRGQRLAGGLPN